MKKILAAVDGSLASIHAAQKALELATGLSAELTLIYVSEPGMLPGDIGVVPELREAEAAFGAAILRDVQKVLDREVRIRNLRGAPAEVIADLAMDEGFDFVVVGNKGRGAVTRMLLGSVADRLVHICKRPVMVVR